MTLDFLKYEEIKAHLQEAHRITSHLPSNLLLPGLHDIKPNKELVLQHIAEAHGGFYLANSVSGWCSAVCRICQMEGTGDLFRQHGEQHRMERVATEGEDGKEEAPPGSAGGETLPREGEAAQLHIKERHRFLPFSCKLCRLRDR